MGKGYKKYLALALSIALILESQVMSVSAASSSFDSDDNTIETLTMDGDNSQEAEPAVEPAFEENAEGEDDGQDEQGLLILPESDDNPDEALGEPIGDDGSIGESAPEGDAEEGLLDDPEKELEDELGKDLEEKLEGELQEDLNGKTVDGVEGEEKIVLRAGAAAKSSENFVIKDGVLVRYTGDERFVSIPDGVTVIGEDVFYENKNIESVSIPDSVEIIGNYAFYRCENLQYVKFGKVKKIGSYAFCYCNRLFSLSLPDGLEEIGDHAFYECYEIPGLNIPDSVQKIGFCAFDGCYQIKKIDIPDSVCEIGWYAFGDYDRKSKPVEVKLPNRTSFKKLGKCVFLGRTISRVTIPQSFFLYVDYDFFDESHIQRLYIEDGIEMIPDYFNDTIIDNIYVPESVKEIDSLSSETRIHGKTGSYAESYAKENGNPFLCTAISVDVGATAPVIFRKRKENVYSYESDDVSVATVNPVTGMVHGVSEGSCIIHIKDFSITWKEDICTCVVTVTKKAQHIVNSIEEFQSPHDYENDCDETWEYTDPEAERLGITFSKDTEVEEGADKIHITDGSNTWIGTYTGKELAGKTIYVYANTVRVRLESNDSVTAYGFKVEKAERISRDYEIKDGVLVKYNGTDEDIVIPDGITEIGSGAFKDCDKITKIQIPDSVVIIDDEAFAGDSTVGLEVILPQNLEELGENIFKGRDISRLELSGNALTHARNNTYGSTYIHQLFIKEGTKKVPDVFAGSSIDHIYIPESVGEIEGLSDKTIVHAPAGSYAQKYAKDHNIPYFNNEISVKCDRTIGIIEGGSPEAKCTWESDNESIATVDENGVVTGLAGGSCTVHAKTSEGTEIGSCAVTVVMPDFLIEDGILVGYYGTDEDVVIPDGVTKIGPKVFYGKDIKSVTLPESVKVIGENAFKSCQSLRHINLENVEKVERSAFSHCGTLSDVDLGKAVEIGEAAFSNCKDLRHINLANVEKVEKSAFFDCGMLSEVVLGKAIEIGEGAFLGCKLIRSIDLKTVEKIGGNAFNNCNALKDVNLEKAVEIGEYAFANCTRLEHANLMNVEKIGGHAFFKCSKLEEVDLGKVVEIGEDAFSVCLGLKNIELPDSLEKLGERAFLGSSISVVTISKGTACEGQVFYHSDIRQMYFKDGREDIPASMLEGAKIDHIYIPNSVTSIGYVPEGALIHGETGSFAQQYANDNSFRFFNSELTVEAGSTITVIDGGSSEGEFIWETDDETIATVDETGTVYGLQPGSCNVYAKDSEGVVLGNCAVTVVMPTFWIVDGVLVGYGGTDKNVVIPDGVKTIDEKAFYNYETLEHIYIPNSVTSIGYIPESAIIHGETGSVAHEYATEHGIKFFNSELTVEAGSTITVINGGSSEGEFIWETDNESIATVDTSGIVTGVSEGSCRVTAKTADGTEIGSCVINVTKKARIVPVSELTISQISAQEYIGGEILPKPEVKDGELVLEEGKHYTLTYASNKAVGTGYVTITGVPENGYEGTKKISFKIKAFDIAKNEGGRFVISYEDTVEYSVKGARPKVSISFNNADGTTKKLKEGTDYTVSYKNNKNYSSQLKPTIVITAKGSYTGKKELQFTLKERDISKANMVATDMLWLGWPDTYCTITVITDSGYILLPGIDYESLKYVYANKTVVKVNGKKVTRNAGDTIGKNDIIPADTTLKVIATAKKGSGYTGTISATYKLYSIGSIFKRIFG